jgi:hypothetical protein
MTSNELTIDIHNHQVFCKLYGRIRQFSGSIRASVFCLRLYQRETNSASTFFAGTRLRLLGYPFMTQIFVLLDCLNMQIPLITRPTLVPGDRMLEALFRSASVASYNIIVV